MQPNGFRMGDHQFYSPEQNAPMSRVRQASRSPIVGAEPPAYLKGKVVEANESGPASALWDGQFCGHGEPTFGVFDVAADPRQWLEIQLPRVGDDGDDHGAPIVMVRAAGSDDPWFALFDPKHFEDYFGSAEPTQTAPYTCPATGATRFRVAIGIEYPCDCESPDEVTWVAIAVQSDKGGRAEIVFDFETA